MAGVPTVAASSRRGRSWSAVIGCDRTGLSGCRPKVRSSKETCSFLVQAGLGRDASRDTGRTAKFCSSPLLVAVNDDAVAPRGGRKGLLAEKQFKIATGRWIGLTQSSNSASADRSARMNLASRPSDVPWPIRTTQSGYWLRTPRRGAAAAVAVGDAGFAFADQEDWRRPSQRRSPEQGPAAELPCIRRVGAIRPPRARLRGPDLADRQGEESSRAGRNTTSNLEM